MTPAEMVREFHAAFGLVIRDEPHFPDTSERALRLELIREEWDEARDAIGSGAPNSEVAGELADMLYVIYGTALHYGIDLDDALADVHRANMSKVTPCSFCATTGSVYVCDGCSSATPHTGDPFPCGECGATSAQVRPCEACDGLGRYVIRRADGKVLKPDTYTPADLSRFDP